MEAIRKFLIIRVNHRNFSAADIFKKTSSLGFRKLRIPGFYDQEERVVCYPAEWLIIKERVMHSGQSIQNENAEKRGEGREQDGQLKHDWEERRNGEKIHRLAVYDQREEKRRGNVFEQSRRGKSEESPAKDDVSQW